MKALDWIDRICEKKCAVLGIGISNLAVIDFLLSRGAHVCARDKADREKLGELAERLDSRGVRLVLGEDYLKDLNEDILFRSPGIRPDHPALQKAVQSGAILTSEQELFFALTPAKILGITGSDGKTTTTTLTGLMLAAECRKNGKGRVFVGGNIGTPLLSRVSEMTSDDFAVVELSSFQLQTMECSPMRAAMTNVTPNHLNWHTDMEEYIRAKTNIYRHSQNQRFIANAENEVTARLAAEHTGSVTLFSSKVQEPSELIARGADSAVYLKDGEIRFWKDGAEDSLLATKDILLPGLHNVENYMTAIALTQGLVSKESIYEVATTFEGVAHRLERVRRVGGVTYYNSSIDSSPTRTAAALSALSPKNPIVICGGYDKKISFAPLAVALCEHAKAVVLTGATAPLIREELEKCERVRAGGVPILENANFEAAVTLAKNTAQEGDIVLLSPACASFDAFKNFEERGETFRRIVQNFTEI